MNILKYEILTNEKIKDSQLKLNGIMVLLYVWSVYIQRIDRETILHIESIMEFSKK